MNKEKEITLDQITPEIALNTLYQTTRKLELSAETHDLLKLCKDVIDKSLNPNRTFTPVTVQEV